MTRPAHPPEPAWRRHCREELFKLDPRYAAVFGIRWGVFGGDCTAAQLARHLAERGYEWAPAERNLRRWLTIILPVETRHAALSDTYQRAETDASVR